MRPPKPESPPPSYQDFDAVHLFCPNCKAALPVRKRLLLVFLDGSLYEYRCTRCNTLVGKKREQQ